MNMFRRRNLSKNTKSLEQRTANSRSWVRNTLGGLGLLAASFLPGCLSNAPYYRPAEVHVKAAASLDHEYDISNNFYKADCDEKNLRDIAAKFVASMKNGTSAIGKCPAVTPNARLAADAGYISFQKQNEALASLLEKKLPALLSYALRENTGHCDLNDYDAPDDEEVQQIKNDVVDFETALSGLGPENRERLKKAFGNDRNLQEAYAWNIKALAIANRYLTALADVHTIEGRFDDVDWANGVSAGIVSSLFGYDAYGNRTVTVNGKEEREGALALEEALSKCSDGSIKNNISLIMNRITERAEKCADDTRHIIANNYFADVLKIAWKAHKDGALSGLEYQSVVRYLTRQAKNAAQGTKDNCVTLGGFIGSLTPWSLVEWAYLKEAALSRDDYSPKSDEEAAQLEETLRYGNAIKNGQGTRWNWAGETDASTFYFCVDCITGPLWLGALSAGGVLGYNHYTKEEKKEEQPPEVPTSGGQTGGPGTG